MREGCRAEAQRAQAGVPRAAGSAKPPKIGKALRSEGCLSSIREKGGNGTTAPGEFCCTIRNDIEPGRCLPRRACCSQFSIVTLHTMQVRRSISGLLPRGATWADGSPELSWSVNV